MPEAAVTTRRCAGCKSLIFERLNAQGLDWCATCEMDKEIQGRAKKPRRQRHGDAERD